MILMSSLLFFFFNGVSLLLSNFERQVISLQIHFIILELREQNFVNRKKAKTEQALRTINC